jgi:hypothetical protein
MRPCGVLRSRRQALRVTSVVRHIQLCSQWSRNPGHVRRQRLYARIVSSSGGPSRFSLIFRETKDSFSALPATDAPLRIAPRQLCQIMPPAFTPDIHDDVDEKKLGTPDEYHEAASPTFNAKTPEQRKEALEAALQIDPGVGRWGMGAFQVGACTIHQSDILTHVT